MKKLILILLLLPLFCNGQNTQWKFNNWAYPADTITYIYTYDTVPAILLVCDTSSGYWDIHTYFTFDSIVSDEHSKKKHWVGHMATDSIWTLRVDQRSVIWVKGYAIFTVIYSTGYCAPHPSGYLFQNKKKMPAEILVWDYKLMK
jgi:hypothetical protein